MSKIFEIKGMRVLHRIVPVTEGHNCDFYETPQVVEEYEILLQHQQFLGLLSLSESYGQCGSGWTTASFGEASLRRADQMGPLTHLPSQRMSVELDVDLRNMRLPKSFECQYFNWDSYGGDEYYPSGHVSVETGLFTPTGRGRNKPLIHVFLGDSNLGKSTLGMALSGSLSVYETDECEEFKAEMVYASVIILGEKHPSQTITGIREFFKDRNLEVDIVPVRFGENVRMEV